MILYHFVRLDYGLENISNRRIKISRVSELNDPFEFQSFNLSDKTFRKAIKSGINSINKEFGLICFSASWRSPLQWAHYANRHTGICLGMEIFPEHIENVHKVTYVDERRNFQVNEPREEHLVELITTKFKKWNYEEEYRIFVPLEVSEPNGLFFTPFKSNMKLREVYLGASCKVREEELSLALGDLKEEVKVIQTRPGFTSFDMVVDQRRSPIRLRGKK